MAGNLFEFDLGLNFGEATNKIKGFAKEAENSLNKLLNPKINLDSKDAQKAISDLGSQITTTLNKIDGINVPTNEIKKLASEFQNVSKSANQSINEQKQALAQMIQTGQKGTAAFDKLQNELKDNVKASNLFKESLQQIDKELEKIDGKNVEVDFDKDGKGTGAFKSKLADVGKFAGFAAIAGGAALAVVGLKKVIDTGIEFQKSLADFSAITGVQGKALDTFGESAKKLSLEFGGSALDQIATFKGLLSKLGPDIAKSPEALERMTKAVNTLALASGMDAQTSMESLASSALQFGIDLKDPIKASEEMTKMMNVMAAGAKEGSAEIPSVSEAINVAGSSAKLAGVSFEETNAAIQTLGIGAKYGAEAGTGLRNVLSKIGSTELMTPDAIAGLKKAGVNMETLTNTSLPLSTRLRELQKVQADGSTVAKLFGIENQVAANTLITNIDTMDKYTKSITNTSVGFEQAKINSQTFAQQIKVMKANLEDVGLKLFDSIKPALDSVFKLFQNPKLMGALTSIITNVGTAIAPIIEMIGTTLTPILADLGIVISETLAQLVPPLIALIKPIMEIVDVLLKALIPVFKNSLLPIIADTITNFAQLLTTMMPLINLAIPLLVGGLQAMFAGFQAAAWVGGAFADSITWVVTAIKDSVKWFNDLIGTIGKFLGLNPAKKTKEHGDAAKYASGSHKELNTVLGVQTQSINMASDANSKNTVKIADVNKVTKENTTLTESNTGATKANAVAKKTLLEQLTELTNKVGAASAINSKLFSDYVIEFGISEKQKAENEKVKLEFTRQTEILNREIQPKIESFIDPISMVVPLERLELTDTGVNYKSTFDDIKLNFEESLMSTMDSVGGFMKPIPFDIVDVEAIDEQIATLKDSYKAGEISYKDYTKQMNDLDEQRADAVISTNDLIANSLMTVSNAMSEMAVTSLQKFKETGEGLNDFLGQAGIALGTMMGAALTSSEDQQKQILVNAIGFAEKLLSIYAVDIIAQFTTWFGPIAGPIAGITAVAGLYTLLEVAKAKVGAEDGVIGITPKYNKRAGSTDTIPIWIAEGESVIKRAQSNKYKEELSVINSNGDFYGFMRQKLGATEVKESGTVNELMALRQEVKHLHEALKNQRTEVYDKRELIIQDNRKVQVRNLPIYG